MVETLRFIAKQYGSDIFKDGAKLIAYYSDLAPHQKIERLKLEYLVKCNGHIMLLNALNDSANEQDRVFKHLVSSMQSQLLLSAETALNICSLFWEGIGGTSSEPTQRIDYSGLITVVRKTAEKMLSDDSVATHSESAANKHCKSELSSNKNNLLEIVNENKKPSTSECEAILSLGRKLLKSGNTTEGIRLIKHTAQHGYDYGSLLLGYCYDNGIGVPKDYHIATAYYGRAGSSGGADASYKKYGWDDTTHRSRAYRVAESIYNKA